MQARARRGRRPGDTTAVCPSALRFSATMLDTHGAFPSVGLPSRYNDVTGRCWSGNRTRNSRINSPMLYPIELSIGGRTGFEPATDGLRRCSTSELSSACGTPSPEPRHTPRQCRAHRTGMQARTAVDRSSMLRIGASSKAPIRVRSHPLAARAEASRHGASLRLRGFPCLGSALSGCFGSAMQSRFDRVGFLLRAPKTKRPRVLEPEGVRVASGDRGDRSPRCERISRCGWSPGNSACRFRAEAHRAVRTRAGPHRAWAMAAVQRCGRNASWNSCVRRIAGRRGGAPYARLFRLATKFLHHRRAADFLQPGGKAIFGVSISIRCIASRA